MTAAFAPATSAGDTISENGASIPGAQILLTLKPARQFYIAEILAVGIYALIIAAGLNYKSTPIEAPPEEPMELVLMPAEAPPPEPPPPPPEPEPPPPPPEAVEPPVAPVEPPPPPKPKIEKPKPKPVPKVEHEPKPRPVAAKREEAAPTRPVPVGAAASVIANQLHGCLMRNGANLYPESQRPRAATVGYRANISASGSVTFSWSSSGNSAFDSAARQAGSRCSSVQAPGRPAALSGVLNFRA